MQTKTIQAVYTFGEIEISEYRKKQIQTFNGLADQFKRVDDMKMNSQCLAQVAFYESRSYENLAKDLLFEMVMHYRISGGEE